MELKLDPHQVEGVAFIEKYDGRLLVADEQGLGKTIQALAWLKSRPDSFPAIIVCPSIAKGVWSDEAAKWLGPKFPVHVVEGNFKRGTKVPTHKIFIINMEVLSSWSKWIQSRGFKTLIVDEAHFFGNKDSARTQALFSIGLKEEGRFVRTKYGTYFKVSGAHPRIKHVLMMSGTPISNHPHQFWPALHVLWPHKFLNPWPFYQKFSQPYKYRRQWIIRGAKNTKKLHKLLMKLGMLRRRKADVYPDMHKKRRVLVIKKLKKSKMEEYRKAERNFILWLKAISKHKALRAKKAETFTRGMYLTRLAAKLKMHWIVSYIDAFMDSTKEKAVIFSYITPLIDALVNRYGDEAIRIDGKVPTRERHPLIKRFQTDPSCRLAICNGKAVSVSVTLHAAAKVIGTDIPWVPSLLFQSEDRVHRRGQTKPVTIVYLLAEDTIEEKIMETLRSKQHAIEKIIDGRDIDAKSLSLVNASVQKAVFQDMLKQ